MDKINIIYGLEAGYNNRLKSHEENQGVVTEKKVTVIQLHMWAEFEELSE